MARPDDRLLTSAEEIQLARPIERGDLAAKREIRAVPAMLAPDAIEKTAP